MTPVERRLALDGLSGSRERLLEAVSRLSVEQWSFRPAPESWSIALCAEHLILVETRVLTHLRPGAGGTKLKRDRTIPRTVPDRSTKVRAPERVTPLGAFSTPADWTPRFEEVRARSIEWFASQSNPRAFSFEHMIFGPLDGYQWMLFLTAHVDRHLLQIGEVRASSGYPA